MKPGNAEANFVRVDARMGAKGIASSCCIFPL